MAFSKEILCDKTIRFLDLELFYLNNTRWKYAPRSKKALLPYESAHSKLVKRSLANLCFLNAQRKSCPHVKQKSLTEQVDLLKASGFPAFVLLAVDEFLGKKMKKLS